MEVESRVDPTKFTILVVSFKAGTYKEELLDMKNKFGILLCDNFINDMNNV